MIALVLLAPSPLIAEPLRLEADTPLATAGYFQLRWDSAGAVELQESASADFSAPRTIYSGLDRARVMSGKPDGHWYYRARSPAADGDWSNIVKVTVRHHPLGRAFGFFALGATVFAATLVVIVRGARRDA